MNRYAEFAEPWRQHEMSMDVRHAGMVGRFLRGLGGLKSVVEVGCCYGVSTAEVLDACEQSGAQCTLIDLAFTQSVVKMLAAACNRVRVSMASDHSAAVLGKHLSEECVLLLDGDHRRVYMELEDEILAKTPPRALILHDITSHRPDCDGPRWMLHRWQAKGYLAAVDYMPRDGERTERGLGILCRDAADAGIARAACEE